MTKSCFKHYLALAAIGLFAILFWVGVISWAVAATTWQPQTGIYVQYKIPPKMTNAYQLTSDIEIPAHWIKQVGTFTKSVSTGGATRYEKIAIVSPPNQPACQAFKCVDDFGITYDLSKNTALTCPMVTIIKGVAVEYDGAQANTSKCR